MHSPVQLIFPSPVYHSLQVHLCVPGPVSAHVANWWQSSRTVPQFRIANKNEKQLLNKIKMFHSYWNIASIDGY